MKADKKKLWMLAVVPVLAMILAIVMTLNQSEKAIPAEDLTLRNADPEGTAVTAFGTEIPKADVASITFAATLEGAPETAVDMSANGSGKVLLWAEETEDGKQALTIAGDGAVYAPADSSFLFGGKQYYLSLREINFNGVFHTENVTNMKGMFYGCSVLPQLDLGSFRTENVTAMDWMFSGCGGLTTLDLSAFHTEKVMELGWMFQNCRALESLNLSSFQVPEGANTFLMFQNCRSLKSVEATGLILTQFEADC